MSSGDIDLSFPVPAEKLIPHRPPMRLIDFLVSCSHKSAAVEAEVPGDSFLVTPGGFLEEVALVELMAQAYAAFRGYTEVLAGNPVGPGFLVGLRDIRIHGPAPAGRRLLVNVSLSGSFDRFVLASGEVELEGVTLASGSLKLWLPPPEAAGGGD